MLAYNTGNILITVGIEVLVKDKKGVTNFSAKKNNERDKNKVTSHWLIVWHRDSSSSP